MEQGWYNDPIIKGQKRYWDGKAWTEQVKSDVLSVTPQEATVDQHPAPVTAPRATKYDFRAMLAFMWSILALLFCYIVPYLGFIFSLTAIISGIASLKSQSKKTYAIVAIATGVLTIFLSLFGLLRAAGRNSTPTYKTTRPSYTQSTSPQTDSDSSATTNTPDTTQPATGGATNPDTFYSSVKVGQTKSQVITLAGKEPSGCQAGATSICTWLYSVSERGGSSKAAVNVRFTNSVVDKTPAMLQGR